MLVRLDSLRRVRECLISTAESQTFVREANNRNEHPQVNVYFRAVGWKHPERITGSAKPWCAAFVTWVLKQCGVMKSLPKKLNYAAVAEWNRLTKWIVPTAQAQSGDVVTYRTWSHAELVKYWPVDPRIRIFRAVGGNTRAGNGQEGVYVDIPRPKSYVRHIIRVVPIN